MRDLGHQGHTSGTIASIAVAAFGSAAGVLVDLPDLASRAITAFIVSAAGCVGVLITQTVWRKFFGA